MRQWLASLMLSVMLLSHGSVGASMPHDHAHVGGHAQVADQVTTHHAAPEHDERVAADKDDPADESTGHAMHTHIVVALAHPTGSIAPARVASDDEPSVAPTPWGPSRDISPLLEPPSA